MVFSKTRIKNSEEKPAALSKLSIMDWGGTRLHRGLGMRVQKQSVVLDKQRHMRLQALQPIEPWG
jgi:hypothetical protein